MAEHFILDRFEQPSNAPSLIAVIDSGIVMDDRCEQS